jgi:hypothetical protein
MPVRVVVYAVAGAILGFIAPIILCAIAAVMLGGPSGGPALPGNEATGADAIVALAPLLALAGLLAGAVFGILRASRRRRPSRL